MTFVKGQSGNPAGKPKGTANKATTAAREAISLFVDNNAHRLQEWLDAVARGNEAAGIPPNPAKAYELFQSVVEYHIPKLARSEIDQSLKGELRIKWEEDKPTEL